MEFFKESEHRVHIVRDDRPRELARIEKEMAEYKMKLGWLERDKQLLLQKKITTRCECCHEPYIRQWWEDLGYR